MMGRFNAFKDWRWNHDTLYDGIACACLALNIEMWLAHGDKGRYATSTPDYVADLHAKAEKHTKQDERYPYRQPLPAYRAKPKPRKPRSTTLPPLHQRFRQRSGLEVPEQRTAQEVEDVIMQKYVKDNKSKN